MWGVIDKSVAYDRSTDAAHVSLNVNVVQLVK